jgi:hypothetical protein
MLQSILINTKNALISITLILLSFTLIAQVPTPNPADNTFYCLNDVAVYGDQIIDPLASYSFSILPVVPFNTISSGDQIEVTWLTEGVYTIEITKTIGLCSSTNQASITVYPLTTPIVITDALCQGNGIINLTANPIGSNPSFSGTGVSGTTFDASGLPIGDYPITFTSTDVNGCAMNGIGNISITSPPSNPIIFTN